MLEICSIKLHTNYVYVNSYVCILYILLILCTKKPQTLPLKNYSLPFLPFFCLNNFSALHCSGSNYLLKLCVKNNIVCIFLNLSYIYFKRKIVYVQKHLSLFRIFFFCCCIYYVISKTNYLIHFLSS